MDINSAWDSVRENIKISAKGIIGYYELKMHKPLFDEGCMKLLDHKKDQFAEVTESKLNKWR
jgi:hypothetical protein